MKHLVTVVAVLLARPGLAEERSEELTGRVADAAGRGVSALVFAADADSDAIDAVTHTDAGGGFRLQVPPRKHYVGIFGARWRIVAAVKTGPNTMSVTVGPSQPSEENPSEQQPLIAVVASRQQIMNGRIADETGSPLGEVAVEARLSDGRVAGRAFSGPDGRYALPLLPGRYDLTARAVGLKLGKARRRDRSIDLVMSIASEAQTIRVFEGHTLTFRIEDSIDPEYVPPAPVKAWLSYAYGIETTSNPLRASQKRATKKYWWLEMLRQAPRNPAAMAGEQARDVLREPELPLPGAPLQTGPMRDPSAARQP